MPITPETELSGPSHRLISPDGTPVGVWSIPEFVAEYDLPPTPIYAVIRGYRQSYKGWRLAKALSKRDKVRRIVVHTDGTEVGVGNATEWAAAMGLPAKEVRKLLRDERKSLAGWSVKGDTMKQKTLYHPSGAVALITNVARWCRENDLSSVAIYEVLRGVRKSYKGWSKEVGTKEHIWVAVSPEGAAHQFKSVREFALANGLDPSNLRKVLLGWAKSHKGWVAGAQNAPTIATVDGAAPEKAIAPPILPENIAPQNGAQRATEAS